MERIENTVFGASLIPGIRKSLETAIEDVAQLRWAYLYGSAARGEAFSDIDVAVMPAAGSLEGLVDASSLAAELSGKIGVKGLVVEVVDLRCAALPFLAEVIGEARVLLDREPVERRFWEAEVTLEWLDFQPLWEAAGRLRRERLGESTWSNARKPRG